MQSEGETLPFNNNGAPEGNGVTIDVDEGPTDQNSSFYALKPPPAQPAMLLTPQTNHVAIIEQSEAIHYPESSSYS